MGRMGPVGLMALAPTPLRPGRPPICGFVAGCYDLQCGREGRTGTAMHFEIHQNVIDDLEARILTIRDSL